MNVVNPEVGPSTGDLDILIKVLYKSLNWVVRLFKLHLQSMNVDEPTSIISSMYVRAQNVCSRFSICGNAVLIIFGVPPSSLILSSPFSLTPSGHSDGSAIHCIKGASRSIFSGSKLTRCLIINLLKAT